MQDTLWRVHRSSFAVVGLFVVWGAGGCVTPGPGVSPSVAEAARKQSDAPEPPTGDEPTAPSLRPSASVAIASVNGIPIARSRVVDLLLRAHGAGVLEQLVGLELAGQLAADQNLTVQESDLDDEYDLALRRLSDPLAMVTPENFDRAPAERILASILEERNISREEFMMTIRRNAYLRKIVSRDLVVSESDLRAEFARVFGRRAEVRHIQLGSDGDVERVMTRLAAGDDFAALANRFSANVSSAKRGGLLEPFSKNDEAVPAQFRNIAFTLSPGEVSKVVQIGEWQHIIRLDRIIPEDKRGLLAVRDELESQLRGRLAEEGIHDLLSRLIRDANIDIRDPNVRKAFAKRRQGRP